MKHFLVTRFNLRLDDWKTAKDGQPVRNEEWLSHRFSLFEHYCLPSVRNQSNQNFIWSVFFDTDTPQKYVPTIKRVSESYGVFRPVFIDGYSKLRESLKNFIYQNIEPSDDFIITTRLDNDDIIHKDFISSIQQSFRPKDKTVIDLRRGYQINIKETRKEIREYDNAFNPFVSVVESSSNFKTVISQIHFDWGKSKSIIVLDERRLWIELVHQKNKLNEVSKNLKRVSSIKGADFGLSIEFAFKDSSKYIYLINIKSSLIYLLGLCKRRLKEILAMSK